MPAAMATPQCCSADAGDALADTSVVLGTSAQADTGRATSTICRTTEQESDLRGTITRPKLYVRTRRQDVPIPRAAAIAALICLAALAVADAAAAKAWEMGTFTPNRGGLGIRLDQTRAQVVAKLGTPVFENQNGFMEYSSSNLFDVYLDTALSPKRIRMIGLSGPDYCVAGGGGVCLMRKGGVGKLKAKYGGQLVKKSDSTGVDCYLLLGMYKGKQVFTSFAVDSFKAKGRIIQVFILWGPPDPGFC
jgi:hypothetical protein